jgi:hypothetical protein
MYFYFLSPTPEFKADLLEADAIERSSLGSFLLAKYLDNSEAVKFLFLLFPETRETPSPLAYKRPLVKSVTFFLVASCLYDSISEVTSSLNLCLLGKKNPFPPLSFNILWWLWAELAAYLGGWSSALTLLEAASKWWNNWSRKLPAEVLI